MRSLAILDSLGFPEKNERHRVYVLYCIQYNTMHTNYIVCILYDSFVSEQQFKTYIFLWQKEKCDINFFFIF
jgi:hypothetical protein